jgi:hypothetical protein
MLAALLLFVTIDPSPANLDRLQGTWDGENGSVLVIDGDTITGIATDGASGFTARAPDFKVSPACR